MCSSGNSRSSAASTARRSSSKNACSVIWEEEGRGKKGAQNSRFVLFFRLERFGDELSISFFEQDFDAPFSLF